jgi:hypothetical protein
LQSLKVHAKRALVSLLIRDPADSAPSSVGAGLLANAVFQSRGLYLTHRIRQQAGSYRVILCSARLSALPVMQVQVQVQVLVFDGP